MPSFRGYGLDEHPDALRWTREVTRTTELDLHLTGGEWLRLGGLQARVLTLPGHSRGQLGLWLPSTGTVLVSDAVLGRAVPDADGHPAFPPTYRFVHDYRASIRRLRDLAPKVLATAHYGVFDGPGVWTFLDESLSFTHDLERALLGFLCTDGPQTLQRLAESLSPRMGEWPDGATGAMAFPVAGHLEDLRDRGLVTTDDDLVPRWRLS